jgi:FKBP-type peptidyl-prolyl cis-trans isomerase
VCKKEAITMKAPAQQQRFFLGVGALLCALLAHDEQRQKQPLLMAVSAFTAPTSFSLSSIRRQQQQPFASRCSRDNNRSRSSSRIFLSSVPSATTTTTTDQGLQKTIVTAGFGNPVQRGDIVTVRYSCYAAAEAASGGGSSTSGNSAAGGQQQQPPRLPFARSQSQKMVAGEGSLITGFDRALLSMAVGEESVVVVPPSLAYGETGVPPFVPPGASVEMVLTVLDAQPATANIDFDTLSELDATPRTATDIAAAFEARQRSKGNDGPELTGLDAFLAKAKNFYFYGLFEGETGQRAPWFLRPSITFPLAFLIVGATFYISYTSGAITERGAQVTDELDEILLSFARGMEGGTAATATASPLLLASMALAMLLQSSPIDLAL